MALLIRKVNIARSSLMQIYWEQRVVVGGSGLFFEKKKQKLYQKRFRKFETLASECLWNIWDYF